LTESSSSGALQNGFYRRCSEASITKRSYSHAGLLYCILRVKNAIGWAPFEVVLRKLGNEKKGKLPSQRPSICVCGCSLRRRGRM
jgi:hypothetical protein